MENAKMKTPFIPLRERVKNAISDDWQTANNIAVSANRNYLAVLLTLHELEKDGLVRKNEVNAQCFLWKKK